MSTKLSIEASSSLQHNSHRWLALIVLLTGTLLPPLDFFIVNVALPVIRMDLHASTAMSQLVVSIYAATYAIMLILGGRLGDLYGRRRAFIGGMLGFGAASCLCGLAISPSMLIIGRLFQGLTAAIMAPQSLALIHAIFPAEEKNRALSFYGATFGLAAVIGQILGGLLIAANLFHLGWRSVFLINLPIIIIAIPSALSLLRESRAERSTRLDIVGAILLAVGLLALIIPLIEGRERNWPWWCWVLLILSLPLLRIFWSYENTMEQSAGSPLIVTSVLESRGLQRNLAAAFFFYTIASFFLIFAIYEQTGLGHSAFTAGLAILPLGIGFLLGPLVGPRIAQQLGAYTATTGMGLEALGLGLTATLVVFNLQSWIAGSLFIIGLGQGIALPALVRLNIEQVDIRWAGLAAGLVNSTLQISAAVSVALIGGFFFTLAPAGAPPQTVQLAFATTSIVIALCLVIAALLSWKKKSRSSLSSTP